MKLETLRKGDATPLAQFDFGAAIPSNFVFSPDGKYLYGSSYYTGVSNIFRYDLASGKLDAVSNTETGFFRPIPLGNDELVVFRYTGKGFVPARIHATPLEDVKEITFLGAQIAEKHEIVKQWKLGSPASIPLDSLTTEKGRYASVGSIRLESIYPVVQGYKDFAAVGVRANFSDPLYLNRASVTASYTPDADLPENERYHVQGELSRYDWTLGFQVNGADFYDLVGPTKTSLKGWAVGLGYNRSLVYDVPRRLDLKADVTYYGDLDRVPDYQGIATNFTDELATRVRLRYEDYRHSLGYVDEEKGLGWERRLRGRPGQGRRLPQALREPRPRPGAADPALLGVAARLARLGAGRRSRRAVRQLLLRRLPQQLGGPPRREALSRAGDLPRPRDQRGRRHELRACDGRVEPAAAALPRRGHAELLPDVDPARALHERPRHER